MGSWFNRGTAEIYAYLLCSAAAAWMTTIAYAGGRPPAIYWILVLVCAVGVARIFTLALREDRANLR